MNLTLHDVESFGNQGSGLKAGKYLRFLCPIHGGDNQRSFQVNPETGHYKCHACGEWGYLQDLKEDRRPAQSWGPSRPAAETRRKETPAAQAPVKRAELGELLITFQKALPGSIAERYLKQRGIPLDVAQRYGLGYAPAGGRWPGKGRERGRVVFPHTDPCGDVVNLYGRAVGDVEKKERHFHLSGPKGNFNAQALTGETVYLCEGPFDALSLIAAGYPESCAIFGVDGLRWEWLKACRVVFCFDQDGAGDKWKELAARAVLLGKEVFWLSKDVYQGGKDLNEAWAASGRLELGEWVKRPTSCPETLFIEEMTPPGGPTIDDQDPGRHPCTPETGISRGHKKEDSCGRGEGAALEIAPGMEYGLDAETGRPETKPAEELRPCPLCHGLRYWRSLGGGLICEICHPPGSPAVVTEWVELAAQAPDPWDPETQDLITWFEGAELPSAPFQLWPWARVFDPERFFTAIRGEISHGIRGLRYRKGLLRDNLRRLRALFGDKIEKE